MPCTSAIIFDFEYCKITDTPRWCGGGYVKIISLIFTDIVFIFVNKSGSQVISGSIIKISRPNTKKTLWLPDCLSAYYILTYNNFLLF